MPEQYYPKRKGAFTLSHASQHGALIRVTCKRHNNTRYYRPGDLLQLFGDVPVDDLEYRMRCEQCEPGSRPEVEPAYPSIAELEAMTVRRLDGVRWVRRITWRDEKGI